MSGSGEGYKATLEWGFWKFIKYFVSSWVIGFITGTLFILLGGPAYVWNLHMANLWLFIPEVVTLVGVTEIALWSRRSEKAKQKKKDAATLEYLRKKQGDL